MNTHTQDTPPTGTPLLGIPSPERLYRRAYRRSMVRWGIATMVATVATGVALGIAEPTPTGCSTVVAYDVNGQPVPVLAHDCIRYEDTSTGGAFNPAADISGGIMTIRN